ncbi:MAG: zinc ribbon domain-containing protein [Deltaproteobacteria bacterium]|nr:MAG: zinc ribbon domain-containing protein [Deltaproteobacteria bacterium]
MPIYEYECAACDKRSEFIQKHDAAPKRKCPKCDELKLKRVISLSSFQLKGKGWYETDFKTKSQRNKS